MTLYSLVLFVHVTAVVGLSAALSFEVLSLFHLRQASTLAEATRWIAPVPRLPFATGGSALVISFPESASRSECQRSMRDGRR